jgi:hypothetical protein
MKKSLKHLFSKLQENSIGQIKDGFTVLKNIRGGTLLPDGNTHCANSQICSGTNNDCTNSGNCSGATNNGNGGCTNHICYA